MSIDAGIRGDTTYRSKSVTVLSLSMGWNALMDVSTKEPTTQSRKSAIALHPFQETSARSAVLMAGFLMNSKVLAHAHHNITASSVNLSAQTVESMTT